jgi:hypothetical protein
LYYPPRRGIPGYWEGMPGFGDRVEHNKEIPNEMTLPSTCAGKLLRFPYKTWSLFLICNPGWLVQNSDRGIGDLYTAFIVFGRAIGPDNLDVWFVNRKEVNNNLPSMQTTDIERMSTYCSKFGLVPSKTPQVVTVISHPDRKQVGGVFVTNLNGSASGSVQSLTELTDELLKTGLDQSSLDHSYWQTVASTLSSVMSGASCYLNKVSFSIKTGVFNAEITHDASGKC